MFLYLQWEERDLNIYKDDCETRPMTRIEEILFSRVTTSPLWWRGRVKHLLFTSYDWAWRSTSESVSGLCLTVGPVFWARFMWGSDIHNGSPPWLGIQVFTVASPVLYYWAILLTSPILRFVKRNGVLGWVFKSLTSSWQHFGFHQSTALWLGRESWEHNKLSETSSAESGLLMSV